MNKNITEVLENSINVADKLEDFGVKTVLESFLERVQNNEYYLPVIGQFSAGKSHLINKLLGQVILPVKSIETTAYITYIKYGENGVELLYKDGTIEKINLEELINLDQQESESRTNSIESIHVSLMHPMLKNGLVLLDTPGVNTLINKHVSLTESVLDQSQYIIYVFGKSVTLEDLKLIERLKNTGIKFLFVRTKLDELKLAEETIEEALFSDRRILTKLEGEELVYFPVCNHIEIGEKPEWRNYFSKLESYISETISQNTQSFYSTSLESRLKVIKEKLHSKLEDKKVLLETTSKNSIQEIEKKQQVLEFQIQNIEREIQVSEKEIASKIPELMSELKVSLTKETNNELSNFQLDCNLELISLDECQEYLQEKFEKSFKRAQNLMIQKAEKKVNQFAENSVQKFNTSFTELKTALENENLAINLDFDMNTYVEKSEENSIKLDKFYRKQAEIEHLLTQKSEELEGVKINKQELDSTLKQMNEVALQLQEDKMGLDESYNPVYITKGGKAGSILKTVGDVLDIAALFIPASGFAKAGSALGIKAAAMASKGGRMAKVGSKALHAGSKVLTLAAKTDKFKDAAKVGETLTKEMNDDGKKKVFTGITKGLSMLSFSHWGEKLGNTIDPLINELDPEYERQFLQRKNALDLQMNEVRNRTLNEMDKSGLFESKEARIRKEAELLSKSSQELEQRLQQEKNKLYSETEAKAKDKATRLVTEKLKASLSNFEKELLLKSSLLLQDINNDMKMAANQFSIDKLSDIKNALAEILVDKQSNVDSVKSFEKEYENLVSVL